MTQLTSQLAAPLIDSHCHLHYDYAPKSTADIVREAQEAGVIALVTVGTDLDSIAPIAAVSDQFDRVYHTVGVHPHEAASLAGPLEDPGLERLRLASQHARCRAIGEIGLDYHYNHATASDQISALEAQLGLALEVQLPVVIHSRDAEDELLLRLSAYAKKWSGSTAPGVIHCFTGTQEFGARCLDLGFLISFSGILTFKNADDLRTCARVFPLEHLMVETDSPYLAPIPMRGKKCEPSYVRWTATQLAEVKGLTLEEVARATTRNAQNFFGLS